MKRLAAIDVGLKRIGTAISLDGKIVIPQTPIIRKNRNQAAEEISLFLKNWDIDILIVGLPKNGNSQVEMEKRIKHFINLIDFNKTIVFIDEYGTSIEAKEVTKGLFKHKKDGKLDSIAAKIILERYIKEVKEILKK